MMPSIQLCQNYDPFITRVTMHYYSIVCISFANSKDLTEIMAQVRSSSICDETCHKIRCSCSHVPSWGSRRPAEQPAPPSTTPSPKIRFWMHDNVCIVRFIRWSAVKPAAITLPQRAYIVCFQPHTHTHLGHVLYFRPCNIQSYYYGTLHVALSMSAISLRPPPLPQLTSLHAGDRPSKLR
jgi:hypothetical protein